MSPFFIINSRKISYVNAKFSFRMEPFRKNIRPMSFAGNCYISTSIKSLCGDELIWKRWRYGDDGNLQNFYIDIDSMEVDDLFHRALT
jgi:hypothetical protein